MARFVRKRIKTTPEDRRLVDLILEGKIFDEYQKPDLVATLRLDHGTDKLVGTGPFIYTEIDFVGACTVFILSFFNGSASS